jgi:hypothetical protein
LAFLGEAIDEYDPPNVGENTRIGGQLHYLGKVLPIVRFRKEREPIHVSGLTLTHPK